MNKSDYVSRRQAALILGVGPTMMEKLTRLHSLTVRQVPGVRRQYFLRAEIVALSARSEKSAAC